MQLYPDSADLTACRTPLFHGVTTNPLILKQGGVPCRAAEGGVLAELTRCGFPLTDAAQLQCCLHRAADCAALTCTNTDSCPPTPAEAWVFLAAQEPPYAQP